MPDLRAEISEWAEYVAEELARARIAGDDVDGALHAATADEQLAYEVLVTLARTVALVLRPDGHPGGPIGARDGQPWPARRAALLVGSAAEGDIANVDALARDALGRWPDPIREARATLSATLDVLAIEPVIRYRPQEGTP